MSSFVLFAAACSLLLPTAPMGELDPDAAPAPCPPGTPAWECAYNNGFVQLLGADALEATEAWTFTVEDAHVYSWACSVSRTLWGDLEGLEGSPPILTWSGPTAPTLLPPVFSFEGSPVHGTGCGTYLEDVFLNGGWASIVGGRIPLWVGNPHDQGLYRLSCSVNANQGGSADLAYCAPQLIGGCAHTGCPADEQYLYGTFQLDVLAVNAVPLTTLAPIEWTAGPQYAASATFRIASYWDQDPFGAGASYVQWLATGPGPDSSQDWTDGNTFEAELTMHGAADCGAWEVWALVGDDEGEVFDTWQTAPSNASLEEKQYDFVVECPAPVTPSFVIVPSAVQLDAPSVAVTLDASASAGVDGSDIAAWHWTIEHYDTSGVASTTAPAPDNSWDEVGPLASWTLTQAAIGHWRVTLVTTDEWGFVSGPRIAYLMVVGSLPEQPEFPALDALLAGTSCAAIDEPTTVAVSAPGLAGPPIDPDGDPNQLLTFVWTVKSPSGVSTTIETSDPWLDWQPDESGEWTLRCRTRDDEGEESADSSLTIPVCTPPVLDVAAPTHVDVGEGGPTTVQVRAFVQDVDSEDVEVVWELLEVPECATDVDCSAGAAVPAPVGELHSATVTTNGTEEVEAGAWVRDFDLSDAGRWRIRVSAWEVEGGLEAEPVEIEILADAVPEAVIDGPEPSLLPMDELLTLDGSGSADPDDGPHLDEDGVSSPPAGHGITTYSWVITGVPDPVSGPPLGPAFDQQLLALDGTEPLFEVAPSADVLFPGDWTFELTVGDAEDNEATETFDLEVAPGHMPPLAIVTAPTYIATLPDGTLTEDFVVSAAWSFDPDQLWLDQSDSPCTPSNGICSWEWNVIPPSGLALQASGPEVTIGYVGATAMAPEEHGAWYFEVIVTDDELETDHASFYVLLGNCLDGASSDLPIPLLCAAWPRTESPALLQLGVDASADVYYHLNAAVWEPFGFVLDLEDVGVGGELSKAGQVHLTEQNWDLSERDFAHPGVLSFDLPEPEGDTLPPGKYDYTLELLDPEGDDPFGPLIDLGFVTDCVVPEPEAVWISFGDVHVLPESDQYLRLRDIAANADVAELHYSFEGVPPSSGSTLTLKIEGACGTVWKTSTQDLAATQGVFTWSGYPSSNAGSTCPPVLDPGPYSMTLMLENADGQPLAEPVEHIVTLYELDLSLQGLPEEDEETPGAFAHAAAGELIGSLILVPEGLPGSVTLIEEDGAVIEGSSPAGPWVDGLTLAADAVSPSLPLAFGVTASQPEPTRLVARWTPPGEDPAEDVVQIHAIDLALDARCSADEREADPGIFVVRRSATGPVDFESEKLLMRSLRFTASHILDGLQLVLAPPPGGTAVEAVANVYARPEPGAPAQLITAWPYTPPPTAFGPDGALDLELFVRGVFHGALTMHASVAVGGEVLFSDEVTLRVGDQPTVFGHQITDIGPYWYPLPVVNDSDPVNIALSPWRHDERRGLTGHAYLVPHRSLDEWATDPTLSDQTGTVEPFTLPAAANTTFETATTIWQQAESIWPGRSMDLVLDYGDCTMGALPDGKLDPDDLVIPLDDPEPALVVLPDLSLLGPFATITEEYGNDFEEGNLGEDCTPVVEDPQEEPCIPNPEDPATGIGSVPLPCGDGEACVDTDGTPGFHCSPTGGPEDPTGPTCVPDPQTLTLCPLDMVCVDTDGVAGGHCVALDPGACDEGYVCVNTDNDEDAHCRPEPERIEIPIGYNGLYEHPDAGAFRLRGRIVRPVGDGPFPVVVLAHGNIEPFTVRSTTCASDQSVWCRWSRFGDYRRWLGATEEYVSAYTSSHEFPRIDGPSYRGFDYLQEHLASHGWLTASVDLEEVSDFGFGYPSIDDAPAGIALRAWIMLKHLDRLLLHEDSADTSQVHLVGHSRGGEAVVAAEWILEDIVARGPASAGGAGPDSQLVELPGEAFELVSVSSIAPTTYHTPDLAPAEPHLLLYGTADGDVNGKSAGLTPYALADRATGTAAVVTVVGGNHNHFNTRWTKDDARPWVRDFTDDLSGKTWKQAGPLNPPPTELLAGDVQRAAAAATIHAWLWAHQHAPGYAEPFRRSVTRYRPLGLPAMVTTYGQSRDLTPGSMVIDDFESGAGPLSSAGYPLTPVDLALWEGMMDGTSLQAAGFAQATSACMLLNWGAGGSASWALGAPEADLRGFAFVSLRLALQPDSGMNASPAFELRLTDTAGSQAGLPLAFEATVPLAIESALPTKFEGGEAQTTDVTIGVFRTARVPLAQLCNQSATGIDCSSIASIGIHAAAPGSGVAIDDLRVEK